MLRGALGCALMRRKVEEIVRETLRPLVEADGGSLTIVEVTDARIELRLGAACAGCPGLAYTQRELLEPLLRQVVGATPRIDIHSRPDPKNAGLKNAGLKNTGLKNTGLKNTGLKNTGLKNTGLKNAGPKSEVPDVGASEPAPSKTSQAPEGD